MKNDYELRILQLAKLLFKWENKRKVISEMKRLSLFPQSKSEKLLQNLCIYDIFTKEKPMTKK
jgi:hypothetical protein